MQQKKIINTQLIDVFITSKTLLIKPTPLYERKKRTGMTLTKTPTYKPSDHINNVKPTPKTHSKNLEGRSTASKQ